MYCTDFKEKLVRSLSEMLTTARVPRTTAVAPISSDATVTAGDAQRGTRVGDLPQPLGAAGGPRARPAPAGGPPPPRGRRTPFLGIFFSTSTLPPRRVGYPCRR